jgi:hypothetical protein
MELLSRAGGEVAYRLPKGDASRYESSHILRLACFAVFFVLLCGPGTEKSECPEGELLLKAVTINQHLQS